VRLAHAPELIAKLRAPTADDPWRVLVSGCLSGLPCGVDGTDYGLGQVLPDLLAQPNLQPIPFCPEDHALGTPRTMPDIHGGDGHAVIRGEARVLDEHGTDLTAGMISGAEAMLEHAKIHDVELAILTDMSAACGSQVISDGCRLVEARRYQRGVGVATAMLLEAGIPVVSQRDFKTLESLRLRLDPNHVVLDGARDHHEHPWCLEYFGS
jgi:uncharacterized protein YbbK (DUF523 family)